MRRKLAFIAVPPEPRTPTSRASPPAPPRRRWRSQGPPWPPAAMANPHVRGTLYDVCAAVSATPPIPLSTPPRYSPRIAPSTADGAAIFSAAKVFGAAANRRTLVNFCHLPPPYASTRSRLALSADRSPASVPTMVVKKQYIAARNIVGARPPEDHRMIGPSASNGVQ